MNKKKLVDISSVMKKQAQISNNEIIAKQAFDIFNIESSVSFCLC